ncbi:hypothetical protein K474DRAFT_1662110 [Panus rudis PR-1116 ss-1]|nr:hypothetical protein K474DRAFT_1662110 [Panus rudis PR-1116 ss-1]
MSQASSSSVPGTPPRGAGPSGYPRHISSPLAVATSLSSSPPNNSSSNLNTPTQGTIRSFSDVALAARRTSFTPQTSSPAPGASTGSNASLSGAATPPRTGGSRARDLLRKHYGLGVGPPPPLSGQGQGKKVDPMDLDSPAFDAKAYYEQLITTASLPVLLKKENDLLTEIRELDSERQSLVYNHHHELIAASDTIGAMKDRAEKLDGDMELLKAAFSEISRLSAEITVEHTRSTEG